MSRSARAPARRVRVLGDLFHGRLPADAVYVGRAAPGLRASRYANPHRVGACRRCGQEHDQVGAVMAYAIDLDRQPDMVAAVRQDLAGVDLACWCHQDVPACHGDVLVLVAAGTTPYAAAAAVLPDRVSVGLDDGPVVVPTRELSGEDIGGQVEGVRGGPVP
ncbi:DUF4326 domain-containing protein (plasmid) [Micromonospora sp. NBC_00821]|uniref:DUF4326 domain-containing protein n=1 Tax=Micromonospora sp. NBC_00821 TaxID=2975977 RepID=UPI002ED2F87A|nr:DUF4326 domain-containing protein [Micromonospora sp. NBC_00821]